MAKCNSCRSEVPAGDAFCGTCGGPVPDATPVVPLTRLPRTSAPTHAAHPTSANLGGSGRPISGGQATATALKDSVPIRDMRVTAARRVSAAAEVVPLRRKKIALADEPLDDDGLTPLPSLPLPSDADSGPTSPIQPVRMEIDSDRPGPVLASELLRQQVEPDSPGEATLRRLTVTLCAIAAPLVLWLGGSDPLAIMSIAMLVGATTLALTPMAYSGRATALFLTGSCAVSVALWQQSLHGIAPDATLLACATILLSSSLLFRAYYRAARMARVLVTCGVLALGVWFFNSEGHHSLVLLQERWYSWGPAVTHALFGLLAVLSLLAFMENTTRGGSHVWAYSLLVLYAVHLGLLISRRVAPFGTDDGSLPGPSAATIVAGAVGVSIASIALAQVFVSAYRKVHKA